MGKVGVKEQKRRSFDLKEKKRIIDQVKVAKAKGESLRSVSSKLEISHATLISIFKSEKEINERLKDNPNTSASV